VRIHHKQDQTIRLLYIVVGACMTANAQHVQDQGARSHACGGANRCDQLLQLAQ
jgi:hypothetical protein